MPEDWLDRVIGFQPWALGLYVSLWLYVSLAPGFIADRRELLAYAVAAASISLVGMAIFVFWPTATPVSALDWSRYPSYDFLKNADAARNACPSLHVAFSVFSGIWIERSLRRIHSPRWIRALNLLWAIGIVYSTLATKQHVVLDVAAGAVLGGEAAALLALYLRRRERNEAAAGQASASAGCAWDDAPRPDAAD